MRTEASSAETDPDGHEQQAAADVDASSSSLLPRRSPTSATTAILPPQPFERLIDYTERCGREYRTKSAAFDVSPYAGMACLMRIRRPAAAASAVDSRRSPAARAYAARLRRDDGDCYADAGRRRVRGVVVVHPAVTEVLLSAPLAELREAYGAGAVGCARSVAAFAHVRRVYLSALQRAEGKGRDYAEDDESGIADPSMTAAAADAALMAAGGSASEKVTKMRAGDVHDASVSKVRNFPPHSALKRAEGDDCNNGALPCLRSGTEAQAAGREVIARFNGGLDALDALLNGDGSATRVRREVSPRPRDGNRRIGDRNRCGRDGVGGRRRAAYGAEEAKHAGSQRRGGGRGSSTRRGGRGGRR